MNGVLVITDCQRVVSVNRRLLRRMVRSLLGELLNQATFELGIRLVHAKEMARLNQTFLRHAGSTDVITFDYAEADAAKHLRSTGSPAGRDASPGLRGDIIVCTDEAVRQARRFGTTWQSELVRYVVHGALHLLGHDDTKPAARRRMKREEDRLLEVIGRRFALRKLARESRLAA